MAATATTGLEMRVSYTDLGLSADAAARAGRALRVGVGIVGTSGQWANQWLPGLPAGTGNLGTDPSLAAVSGAQHATVVLSPAGDVNGDGGVTIEDLYTWHAAPVDLNGDGAAEARGAAVEDEGRRG